jgi:hypothetical protein
VRIFESQFSWRSKAYKKFNYPEFKDGFEAAKDSGICTKQMIALYPASAVSTSLFQKEAKRDPARTNHGNLSEGAIP